MSKAYLMVLSLIAIACCAYAEDSTNPIKTTRLGVITILTGQYSNVGQASANAARLAVEDFQKENPDQQIKLLLEDDGADQKKGLSAFQKLRSIDKADIILPISTFGIGAVHEIINRERRLTFIMGNEPYEPEDDFIYMVSPAAIPAEEAFGEHIAQENPNGEILVIASQNQAILRFGLAACKGAGKRCELIELPSSSEDNRALATRVASSKPAATLFVALPKDSAAFLKTLQGLNFKSKLYFDETIGNSLADYREILGNLEFLKDAGYMSVNTKIDPTFSARYKARFGVEPEPWTDYAYDSVRLTLFLKDRSPDDARKWLQGNSYQGVSGQIIFDQLGLRKPQFSFGKLSDFVKIH